MMDTIWHGGETGMSSETLWKLVDVSENDANLLSLLAFGIVLGALVTFKKCGAKGLWFPLAALLLAGVATAYQFLLSFLIAPGEYLQMPVFALVGLLVLAYFGIWLFWERKSRMPLIRRACLSVTVYLLLAGNITWVWMILKTDVESLKGVREQAFRVRLELRDVAMALESYSIDHNLYPPAVDVQGNIVPFPHDGTGASAGYLPWLLTTPTPYTSSLPWDVFKRKTDPERLYRYATNGLSCWIMTSRGPDKDDDVSIEEFPDPVQGNCERERFMGHFGIGKAIEYDLTNGVVSSGDIVRTGPW
jgi:hypothetical protein